MINIKNVLKKYGNNTAIDDLSLDIKEGEIFGLLGPNGAGKTSLINAIIGLNKIDKGDIFIFGKTLDENEKEIKRQMGIVPQDLAIYNDLTAYENIDLFASLYGLKGKEKNNNINEVLGFVGLLDKKDEYPKSFSGGMKRRLNIAVAIVHQPKLVIMDEPTVGIDPQSRNKILESVRILNKRGTTIIYTTHYMEEVEAVCSNIGIIDSGKLIAKGSKEELKNLVQDEEKAIFKIKPLDINLLEDIRNIEGVNSAIKKDESLEIIWNREESKLSNIVKLIGSKDDINIESIKVESPNLETVFLTLTGKKLRD